MRYIALVYQAGLANVFEVSCRHSLDNPERVQGDRKRLLQHAFEACVWYSRGRGAAGDCVRTFSCNKAGDIISQPWEKELDDCPFRDAAKIFPKRRTWRASSGTLRPPTQAPPRFGACSA